MDPKVLKRKQLDAAEATVKGLAEVLRILEGDVLVVNSDTYKLTLRTAQVLERLEKKIEALTGKIEELDDGSNEGGS